MFDSITAHFTQLSDSRSGCMHHAWSTDTRLGFTEAKLEIGGLSEARSGLQSDLLVRDCFGNWKYPEIPYITNPIFKKKIGVKT